MFKRKVFLFLLVFTMLIPSLSFANEEQIKDSNTKSIEFKTIYEFKGEYDKVKDYQALKISLKDNETLDLYLDTGSSVFEVSDLLYKQVVNNSYNTTLITATGDLNENTSISMRIAYDQIKNANGNAIITKTYKNEDGETITEETLIYYSNCTFDPKDTIKAIKKQREKAIQDLEKSNPQSVNGNAIAAGDPPYVKSYKYGNYMYAGVFWNTSDLVNGENPLFIKFVPLGSIYSHTFDDGMTGTLIKDQSTVIKVYFDYEFVGSGTPKGLTYPIVVETPQRYFSISVGWQAAYFNINIPYGATNYKIDGNPGGWRLNEAFIDFDDGTRHDIENFWLQGRTTISGVGQTTYINSKGNVKVGALYYMGGIYPARDIYLEDTYSNLTLPQISTTIRQY